MQSLHANHPSCSPACWSSCRQTEANGGSDVPPDDLRNTTPCRWRGVALSYSDVLHGAVVAGGICAIVLSAGTDRAMVPRTRKSRRPQAMPADTPDGAAVQAFGQDDKRLYHPNDDRLQRPLLLLLREGYNACHDDYGNCRQGGPLYPGSSWGGEGEP